MSKANGKPRKRKPKILVTCEEAEALLKWLPRIISNAMDEKKPKAYELFPEHPHTGQPVAKGKGFTVAILPPKPPPKNYGKQKTYHPQT